MNFFDSYDISGSSAHSAAPESAPSLDEEVTQVVGQLSRFWGGFRRQSQAAFEAARKDLGEVVSQAQKEVNKFAAETLVAPTSPREDVPSTDQEPSEGEALETAEKAEPESPSAEASNEGDSGSSSTETLSPSQTIFSRLQSSLPPNLVSNVQKRLPESLKHARIGSLSTLDFEQLRSTLTTELHRVQDATGEYVKQSEELLREAGEFLKDAVKVLPPEEGDSLPGVVWDGTDVWMLPTEGIAPSISRKGKEREARSSSGSGRPSVETLRAVATRAESMLKQLKHGPEVIRVDPQSDERVKEMFDRWVDLRVVSEEGGIDGEKWKNAAERALIEPIDGEALKSTFDTLVPSVMTSEVFWTRYFFRVHQVEQEEERRKAIIQGTIEHEEDFSWEDDDDDTPASAKLTPSEPDATPTSGHQPADSVATIAPLLAKSEASTPGNLSPHESEDSYDVVSSTVSESKAQSPSRPEVQAVPDEEEADSDWE